MKPLNRLLGVVVFGTACAAFAQVPAGYPADYSKIVDAAKKEGKVVVYGATDTNAVAPLMKDFQALYPGVTVEYSDMNTTEVYNRVISEQAAGAGSADVVWSSSMDLQVKLVGDGYALTYASPEIPKLPDWSVWKNEAYGITYEPIVFAYNKRLLKPEEVPQSHAELVTMLNANVERFKGKVTSYDIEKSGVGFMMVTQDVKANPNFWDVPKAFGNVGARFQSSSGTMMERLSSGENLLAYNLIGTYAILRAKKDPSIGVVMPKDYTLVLSRVMFISKSAKNPNAAKLWLDYLLSQRGQKIIANQSDLGSIRSDVEGEVTAAGLQKTLGASLKPVPVNPSLLTYLDPAKRLDFLKQWQSAVKGTK
ncbi:ABC transporter substrate-binding protein [Azoarcus sp. KH32C]|uniref:ABC transporter substrate-binding protein n=1 Tax=Azoarcus sp. KH32C TaxID=748247 RepID=UPI0002386E49|nr:ABC transporter substrate-binding protein [Azoarcus sp. KH32C]BAL22815.1 iron (III)-binding protein [Azoarcus sp. KH32C]